MNDIRLNTLNFKINVSKSIMLYLIRQMLANQLYIFDKTIVKHDFKGEKKINAHTHQKLFKHCNMLFYGNNFCDTFISNFAVKKTTKVMVHARGNFEKNLLQYGMTEKQEDSQRKRGYSGDPPVCKDK